RRHADSRPQGRSRSEGGLTHNVHRAKARADLVRTRLSTRQKRRVRVVKLKAVSRAITGTVVLVGVLLLTSGALARSNSLSPGQFVISGDITNKVVYSTAQLAALPDQQTETVSFVGPGGLQTHLEQGPLLWNVANNVVEPDWANSSLKNAVLRYFVEAIG